MNNLTEENSSSYENLSCTVHIQQESSNILPLHVYATIVGILITLINGGVFVILIKDKDIRKNSFKFLVLLLCVSDFTIGLAVMCISQLFLKPSLQTNNFFTVLQTSLMINGLCLSLLQTFLISLQRYLVICKENWNLYIFQQNRKYFVCFGSLIVITIINFALISPPQWNYDIFNERALLYVYHGHYQAHSMYLRFLSLSLLSSTLILYIVTVCFVLKTYQKISSVGDSTSTPRGNSNTTNERTIHVQPLQICVANCATNDKKNVIINTNLASHARIRSLRRAKVVSTLKLIGILIALLVVLTGPYIFSLWTDDKDVSTHSKQVMIMMCVLNSLANLFVYVSKIYDIRKTIKSRLRCDVH